MTVGSTMQQEQSVENRKALAPYKQSLVRYIRATMALRGFKYSDLAEALAVKGIIISDVNLRNKVSKGMFPADLFIALIAILNVEDEAISAILSLVDDAQA